MLRTIQIRLCDSPNIPWDLRNSFLTLRYMVPDDIGWNFRQSEVSV